MTNYAVPFWTLVTYWPGQQQTISWKLLVYPTVGNILSRAKLATKVRLCINLGWHEGEGKRQQLCGHNSYSDHNNQTRRAKAGMDS